MTNLPRKVGASGREVGVTRILKEKAQPAQPEIHTGCHTINIT